MTRREFIRNLAGAAVAVLAGISSAAARLAPRRFVRAAKAAYPGPKAAPDHFGRGVRQVGRWAG